jgi:GT2 family glycosyltransferase
MVRRYEARGADALCGGFAPHALETRAERYLHHRMQLLFGASPKPVRAAPMMNFLIARTVFDAARGFLEEPIEAAEDWEFCLRLGAQGKTIYYDPAVSVIHRYQQGSDAMRQRIRATAALGVHIVRRHGRNLTFYTGYSILRFLASPLWILWRFPIDLYPTALSMEALFIGVRLKTYLECLARET